MLLSRDVQPNFQEPTILYDYPRSQAALARTSGPDSPWAHRYEWFARGVELGNGYDELTDESEMRRRTGIQAVARQGEGRRPLNPPKSLFHAMRRGLPDCCGVAVGVDRLQMVVNGRRRLADPIGDERLVAEVQSSGQDDNELGR